MKNYRNKPARLTIEEALLHKMKTESGRQLAYQCYYERNTVGACQRFSRSGEWCAIKRILEAMIVPVGKALDLGAGNGIASYSLARLGFEVIAVEPDDSSLIGYGAISNMIETTGLPVEILCTLGENLPIKDGLFSLVYARQVLHHARDLQKMVSEVARVLEPGGVFIACREHVIDDDASLQQFLDQHPLHSLTGSEGAFTLDEYTQAIKEAGLTLCRSFGPWDTVINHYPTTNTDLRENMIRQSRRKFGALGALLAHLPGVERWYRRKKTANDRTPGRMYTFVCRKPGVWGLTKL